MRALLTGVTGFVGSHLARALLADGDEVHAVVRPGAHLDRIPDLRDRLQLHEDDGGTGLAVAVEAARPEVTFHLATRFIAEHQPPDVGPLVADNVAFPARLLEALDGSGSTFVNVGTAWQHVDGSPYRPKNLYAATKQAFEDVLAHYRVNGGRPCATVHLFDSYGPQDHRGKLLAALLGALRTGTPLEMSSGEQLVDLVHVDDIVRALRLAAPAAVAGVKPAHFAAGTGQARSLRDVVAVLEQVAGRAVPVRWGARPDRAGEMRVPWDAGSPVPGWQPRVPLAEGLADLLAEPAPGSASRLD
jgi:nucleoside-diphosphate-sugar epimerase